MGIPLISKMVLIDLMTLQLLIRYLQLFRKGIINLQSIREIHFWTLATVCFKQCVFIFLAKVLYKIKFKLLFLVDENSTFVMLVFLSCFRS